MFPRTKRTIRPANRALSSKRAGVSRPALWRVLEIHGMIRKGVYPNCSTLAKEIEVTPKTIQRDVNFMRDQLNLPLEYHANERGYYYTKEVQDFPVLNLSRNDLMALFLARHAMEPLRGTRLESMLAESFQRIANACAGEVSLRWHELDAAFSVKATGVLAADAKLFGDLLDAVMEHKIIRFDYYKLAGSKKELRRVHPYHLAQVEHGWYLLAYDMSRKAMRTFALQRISNLRMEKSKFERSPDFNASEHLGGGFGVWNYEDKTQPAHAVRIRFTGYAARVVSERLWHSTQEIMALKRDGSAIEFRANLTGFEEITRWVLSWGRHAQVVSPAALKNQVRTELEAMRILNEE